MCVADYVVGWTLQIETPVMAVKRPP
jgi:hypothetical protein